MTMNETRNELTTRAGFRFYVRGATPQDEATVAEFFEHVTPEDIRFRFLSGMKQVSHDRLVAMTSADEPGISNFLAFSPDGTLLAVAMLACDDSGRQAEVALSIRQDYKRLGISWELLSHMARYAQEHGIQTIESIESRENHEAIALERDMGFEVTDDPNDPTLVLVRRDLGAAAN